MRIVGLEDQRDRVAVSGVDMPVDRVVADVERAILEPADVDRVEAPVGDIGRAVEPVEPLSLLGPERVGLVDAAAVHRLVLLERAAGALPGFTGNGDGIGIAQAGLSRITRFAAMVSRRGR